jgi:hypothetical protein
MTPDGTRQLTSCSAVTRLPCRRHLCQALDRGVAVNVPQPRSGAPKAQDLMAAIAVAAPLTCAVHRTSDMLTTSLTRADASMSTLTTPRIYTCLTDATVRCSIMLVSISRTWQSGML